jgi:hypothetical protein
MATNDYLSDIGFTLGEDEVVDGGGGQGGPPHGSDLLASALALAARGLKVFPLRTGTKLPIHTEFYDVATSDAEAVRQLWTYPVMGFAQAHNIGIATDDMIAVDIDVKRGKPGEASYAALNCPPTFTQRTPSGGRHALFTGPSRSLSVGKLGDGLDIRSAHGYVVGAGSWLDVGDPRNHGVGGLYEIEDGREMAACPQHVLDKLDAPRERALVVLPSTELDTEFAIARAAKYLREEAPVAIEGMDGDGMVYRIACIVKDMGLSEPATLDAMIEHYMDRCASSFSPAEQIDWFKTKVENAFAYALSPPGSQSPVVDFHGVGEIPPPIRVERERPSLRVRFLGDEGAHTQPKMLVRRILPEVGIAALAGQSRTGKTFVSLYLSTALSLGGEFFGHVARERVGVLFVAAEAPGSIGPRLEALRRTTLGGIAPADIPVAWADLDDVPRPADLTDRVATVIAAIELLAEATVAAMQDRFGQRLGVIVLGTVGAAFGAADSDDEAAKLVMGALDILSRKLGVLIIPLFHFGKDDRSGITGSYYWTASADVILAITGIVSETEGTVKDRRIAMTKNKIDEQGPISAFDLVQVSLGVDRDGFDVTSAIVTPTSTKPKAERPSPHADLLVQCFHNAMVDKTVYVQGQPAAERRMVRDLFAESKPGSKDSGNVSRAFAAAERWANVEIINEDGIDYLVEQQWPHNRLP